MRKAAVVCNYILKRDRIGGMDRFFVLFDEQLKEKGYAVDWFFTDYTTFEFYNKLNIYSANNSSIEKKFLENLSNYDIIITHFTELCAKFYRDIKVNNPNSYVISVDHNPRPLAGFPLKKRIIKYIKSILYASYIDKFIAVSKYSEEHLVNDFGKRIQKKIVVVYNGILSNNFLEKQSYRYGGRFIVACHLRKEKGIQFLINAIGSLNTFDQKKIKVDIYGEGPYSETLKVLVNELNLETVILFKGSVPNLHEIYYQYDYLIHPSLGETFCYTVVESLLCKLPVITTKCAGNVLGLVKNKRNGFIFEEADKKELTVILSDIINDIRTINKSNFESVILPDLSLSKMVYNHINLLP
ncbi:glycosyltransferase family 4 protein [Flavicella sp.]|uniref:glycosyltransferase family 4 protein n=1 Tax=Flavicella sp. TaxID=2957742 RepID=UPI00301799DF